MWLSWLKNILDRKNVHLHYMPSQGMQLGEFPSHQIESGSEKTKRQQHETDRY
jgi:hypothetical protein